MAQKDPKVDRKREAVFQAQFLDDLRYWAQQDRKLLIKLLDIVEATVRDPFEGIGKPEPLRHKQPGTWSRRLNKEHRVVYLVLDDRISFLQARYHY
ncbi:MAG TPA: Txe/YoeB family addiction module toxin [Pyrinomonadaceae bacterium]|nr:Txe/YoeB family addiction module toxin [Pyrinomonadaceae bacterium]